MNLFTPWPLLPQCSLIIRLGRWALKLIQLITVEWWFIIWNFDWGNNVASMIRFCNAVSHCQMLEGNHWSSSFGFVSTTSFSVITFFAAFQCLQTFWIQFKMRTYFLLTIPTYFDCEPKLPWSLLFRW